MMMGLQKGDTVRMASGGPAMVVLTTGQICRCAWYDDNGDVAENDFPEICLDLVHLKPKPLWQPRRVS